MVSWGIVIVHQSAGAAARAGENVGAERPSTARWPASAGHPSQKYSGGASRVKPVWHSPAASANDPERLPVRRRRTATARLYSPAGVQFNVVRRRTPVMLSLSKHLG